MKALYIIAIAVVLYFGVAAFVFQWRNPGCNTAGVVKNMGSVLRFECLPQYQ